MRRTHTRDEALLAVGDIISLLDARVASDKENGVTPSRFERARELCEEVLEHLKAVQPGTGEEARWVVFNRYVADALPLDDEMLKTIQDAQRVVRIYLRDPDPTR